MNGERWSLIEGDCLQVLPTLGAGSVDAVVTDQPYGINCTKVGSGEKGKGTFHRFTTPGAAKIEGDKSPDPRWLAEAFRALKSDGMLYLFSRWDVDREWQDAIEAAGFRVKNRIIWAKAHYGSGDLAGAFGSQHETIWRAARGKARLRVGRTGDVWRDAWTECIRHGKLHPFEKPVDLMEKCVLADTDPGDLVLDPFAGSGTTGVACLRTGRRFLGIELVPEYCAIARRRLEAEAAQPQLFPPPAPADAQGELF